MILQPTGHNKLLMHWKRHFPAADRNLEGTRNRRTWITKWTSGTKIFHINMLKKYEVRREDPTEQRGEASAIVTMSED